MRLSFKPMPWLSVLSLLGLALLLKLGFWQKARLAWKTELLAQVEAAIHAPPLTDIGEVQAMIHNEEFLEFRRVEIPAIILAQPPYYVFTARNRDQSWRKFHLMRSKGQWFFADLGVIDDAERGAVTIDTIQETKLIGYIRMAEWQEEPHTDSTPDMNRWFGFNPMPKTHDWGDKLGYTADMRFFIETVEGETSGENLAPKRPEIANNHFDYMLTWFAMAILLIIFYVLIHILEGRLGTKE